MLTDYLDWPGQAQVYCLTRKFSWVRHGKIYKISSETEYGITSLAREQASPSKVLHIRRKHWRIETALHYCRDVTFREDGTRMTIGPAGRILAMVNNLVLGLIRRAGYSNAAKARRYYEGHLREAFSLLITGKQRS